MLDTSGSMRKTLGTVKDVAHAFLGTANPDNEFLLLAVSTEPDAISGFTTDTAPQGASDCLRWNGQQQPVFES